MSKYSNIDYKMMRSNSDFLTAIKTLADVCGNATIGRDLRNLIQSVKKWRERRAYRKELKRKYGHLNKPKK